MKTSVLIPTAGEIATVREHAAMAGRLGYDSINCGKPEDVAAGVARYRAAGATDPMITNITGTDLGPTLRAAVAAQAGGRRESP